MTTRDLLEIILALIGAGGAVATISYSFAISQEKVKLDKLRLELKDYQLDFSEKIYQSINEGQLEFSRKVAQNIEANRVDIGELKCDVRDVKGVLVRNKLMVPRPPFPEENKPHHTGFS